MRIVRVAAIAFTALFLSSIGVNADGTWCANYKNGLTNCGFYYFEQCVGAMGETVDFATLGQEMKRHDQ